jgi:hypothetical protein
MDINDLTIGQAKELAAMFGAASEKNGIDHCIGKKVIIRTNSAGAWFGTLAKKSGNEVVLESARRMWIFWCAESISLSAVAIYGVKHDKSKIVEPVPSAWMEAIEIIPCSEKAIASLEGAPHVAAE